MRKESARKEEVREAARKEKKSPPRKEKKVKKARDRSPTEERAYRKAGEVKEELKDTEKEKEPRGVTDCEEGEEEEAAEEDESVHSAGEDPADTRGIIPRRRNDEERQKYVDEFVGANPTNYGLAILGPRGSVKRHYDRVRGERPPEPDHSPPRRDSSRAPLVRRRHLSGSERATRRDRSKSRKRKSKGKKHRERGKNWYKRSWKTSWRQKQHRQG